MSGHLSDATAMAKLSHHIDCFETSAVNQERYRACRMVAERIEDEMPEWINWPKWRVVLFGMMHPRIFFRKVGRIEAMGEIIQALKNDEHRAMIRTAEGERE